MDNIAILQAVVLVVLLFLSSFFSSAETALTTVNLIRIGVLAEEGDKKARTVLAVTENRSKMLTTILIGNNIVNISATSLMTLFVIRLFGSDAVGIASGILTLLVLIFGEITPKSFAAAKAEEISLRYAGIIQFLMLVLTPVIFLVEGISRMILLLFHVDPNAHKVITESELRSVVDVSEKEGVIESDESQMINNVIDLGDTRAEEIMIPRVDMTEVPIDIDYQGLIEVFRRERYTRVPVFEGRSDNIVGIINLKDLLLTNAEEFDVKKVMVKPAFTFETKNISDLLDEMREKSLSIVIVLDEYGAAAGLITMEDILEEIVGDIRDEYEGRDAPEITELTPGKEYTCRGSIDIDNINAATGLSLVPENYHTIGGYLIEHSEDSLPKVGEYIVTPEGAKLIVEAVHRNRIQRVHIYLPGEGPEEEPRAPQPDRHV